MYFFVNGKYLLKGDSIISDVYKTRADKDGFLYIIYQEEQSFGAAQWIDPSFYISALF